MPVRLRYPFLFSLFCLLIAPVLFPSFRLFYFAPFLALSLYRRSGIQTLWLAAGCGLLIDLLSSSSVFGSTAANYILSIVLIRPLSRYFFQDQLSTLPLMTFFFSFCSTLFQVFFTYFFGVSFAFSARWVLIDLFFMPFLDALYGLGFFVIPFYLSHKLSRLKLYVAIRKKNRRRAGKPP